MGNRMKAPGVHTVAPPIQLPDTHRIDPPFPGTGYQSIPAHAGIDFPP